MRLPGTHSISEGPDSRHEGSIPGDKGLQTCVMMLTRLANRILKRALARRWHGASSSAPGAWNELTTIQYVYTVTRALATEATQFWSAECIGSARAGIRTPSHAAHSGCEATAPRVAAGEQRGRRSAPTSARCCNIWEAVGCSSRHLGAEQHSGGS